MQKPHGIALLFSPVNVHIQKIECGNRANEFNDSLEKFSRRSRL